MTSGDNPAIEEAGRLAIDDVEAALLGSNPVKEWEPGDPAIIKEPKRGSFEKLLQTMSQTR